MDLTKPNSTVSNLTVPTSLEQWLSYCRNQHHQNIDLGLDRVRQVAERLNLCRLPATVVLIAGTNGKGSTSRILEGYLLV